MAEGAAIASMGLTGASTLLSFEAGRGASRSQRTAGKIRQMESETEAQGIELAAQQREADRKERLAQAMSSQIARGGASGVSAFEGSPLSILQETVREADIAQEREGFQFGLSALTKRAQGRAARRFGDIQARQMMMESTAGLLGGLGQLVGSASQSGGGGGAA